MGFPNSGVSGAGTGPVSGTRTVAISGGGGPVPDGSEAVTVNVTVTGATAAGTVTLWATGAKPGTANVHYTAGQTVSNAAVVPLDALGRIQVNVTGGATHVVVDVAGYFRGAVNTWTHTYDANGNRRATTGPPVKWGDSGARSYQWSTAAGLPVLAVETRPWAAGGADTFYWLYGPDHVPVAQVNPNGTVYLLHRDQLGSIALATTTGGAVALSRAWDPYGKPVASTGTALWPIPFGWAGDYRDDSGLINLRARHYDPVTGTFLQRDPLVSATREAYGYTGGNPLNATDPSGLYCITGVAGYDASGGEICNGADEARDNLNPDKNYFAQVWDHQLDKDWGTAAAGSFNVVYGGTRFLTGIAALQASGACGMFGPEMVVVCAGASAYMIVTGGARVYRGVNQLRDFDNNPYASGDGCSVGSNAGRFVRGIAPKPAGSIWDLLGGLP